MNRKLPSYPLLLIDPYFSLWSAADTLNEADTCFWTGAVKRAYGYVQCDGETFRFLGGRGGKALTQTGVEVTAFSTNYFFTCDKFDLKAAFLSPRDPRDPMLLSMPACQIDIEIAPKTNGDFTTAVFFDEDVCYDSPAEVKGGVVKATGYRAAFLGRSRQLPLSNSQDGVAADWGYIYAAGEDAFYLSESAVEAFRQGKAADYADAENERKYIAAIGRGNKSRFAVGMDDIASINYFGKILNGLYLSRKTIIDALDEIMGGGDKLLKTCGRFDDDLAARCGGRGAHYRLVCAALRQSVAAHKLVSDGKRLLFISKECHSNGCAATVDISYPSSPLFLLYNPELIWGMLEPVFEFADKAVWTYDFAPHDVGTYPLCTGQVYGLNNRKDRFACDNYEMRTQENRYTNLPFYLFPAGNDVYRFENQMPVEESANMIILTCAAYRLCPRKLGKRLKTLETWAGYLVEKGLMPGNQLCTDDFAGHLDKNANLSLKAIVGLGAFASLMKTLGKERKAEKYRRAAEEYAAKWEEICYKDREYAPLTMDGAGAYSLKYNLLFDKLLGLKLFSEKTYRAEIAATHAFANRYGTPLDERKNYTKSDWLMWMAALGDSEKDRAPIFAALDRYLAESPTRVPFSDWFDTETAAQCGFCNRTVQGGIFAVLLADSKLLKKQAHDPPVRK